MERAFSFGNENLKTGLQGGHEFTCMTNESCCAKCAATGKTCCQETEIYVTFSDVKRIAAFTARIDFFEFRLPADQAYLASGDDPPWQQYVFRRDGSRRVLKHRMSGDCIFLDAGGCCLTLDARPLVCRLYPLTYTVKGIQAELDERCPAQKFSKGKSIPEAFGVSMHKFFSWHAELYTEMMYLEGDGSDENWPYLRPAV